MIKEETVICLIHFVVENEYNFCTSKTRLDLVMLMSSFAFSLTKIK